MLPIREVLKRNPISAAGANAVRFAAGYRFARTGTQPQPATSGHVSAPGRLEKYFDQNTTGPGVWKWRHYFPVYEKHLAKFVDKSPTVAEIGVYSGGSLGMWHHYFGPGTRVCGIDREPACRAYQDADTSIFIGDQADPRFLQSVVKGIPEGLDVIIDDGGHRAFQQIATLEGLLPHLRPGGVYACEDIQGRQNAFLAYIEGLARNLHTTGPGYKFKPTVFQATIESVALYPFMVVIETRQSPLTVLEAPKHGTEWQPFFEELNTSSKP